jgi:hypothetical protein
VLPVQVQQVKAVKETHKRYWHAAVSAAAVDKHAAAVMLSG